MCIVADVIGIDEATATPTNYLQSRLTGIFTSDGGTITNVVDGQTVIHTSGTLGAYFDIDGTTLNVYVEGVASTNIAWQADVKAQRMFTIP